MVELASDWSGVVTDVQESQEAPEAEPAQAPERRIVMVEWVGENPHGTSLHSLREITRAQVKEAWGLSISKDLRWTRENGFRLIVEGNENALTPEVLEHLKEDPKFKLHYETVQEPAEDDEA